MTLRPWHLLTRATELNGLGSYSHWLTVHTYGKELYDYNPESSSISTFSRGMGRGNKSAAHSLLHKSRRPRMNVIRITTNQLPTSAWWSCSCCLAQVWSPDRVRAPHRAFPRLHLQMLMHIIPVHTIPLMPGDIMCHFGYVGYMVVL